MVDTVISKPNGTAFLVSPTYKRSSDGKSRCLRFRYMLRGSRKKMLTIFQKMESYSEIPIWTWKRNTGRNWVYGQVPLTSTSNFKVISKLWNLLLPWYQNKRCRLLVPSGQLMILLIRFETFFCSSSAAIPEGK